MYYGGLSGAGVSYDDRGNKGSKDCVVCAFSNSHNIQDIKSNVVAVGKITDNRSTKNITTFYSGLFLA